MAARVGDIEIVSLSDGEEVFPFGFDGVFPEVPAAEIAPWRAIYPAAFASATHPPARYGAFLLRTPAATVLVDTGFGTETGPFPPGGLLVGALASRGVLPADIDLVVFSHLHPDHVGQAFGAGGEAVFEHARYAVAAGDWRLTSCRSPRGSSSCWGGGEETELVPGVFALPAPGHTAVAIRYGGATALLAADAFFHPAQLAHPGWRNSADTDPVAAEATRRALLERVLDRDTVVGVCHFPEPGLGHVATVAGAPHWLPLA